MSKLLKNDFRDETTSDFSSVSYTPSGAIPESLLITVDATHAGYVNRNGFCYDSGAMSYAVSQDVWIKPFEKPLLKNHDMESEPLGRVSASRYIKTSETEGFTQLDVKVTDKEAIQKIIDGRYLTVSTHGAPMEDAPAELQYVKCSICGTNILTADEWCGHMRGNVYENEKTGKEEKCFWTIGAMDYKEVSIVNAPADYRSEEGAAQIVSYSMMDGEKPLPYHTEDKHREALVFSDSEVEYATSDNMEIESVANSILWEAVDHDKEAYIAAKGLVYVNTDKESEDNENKQKLKGDKPENPPVKPTMEDILTKYDSWEDQITKYIEQLGNWDGLSPEDQQEILVYTEATFKDNLETAKELAKETEKQEQIDSVLKSLELIQ